MILSFECLQRSVYSCATCAAILPLRLKSFCKCVTSTPTYTLATLNNTVIYTSVGFVRHVLIPYIHIGNTHIPVQLTYIYYGQTSISKKNDNNI